MMAGTCVSWRVDKTENIAGELIIWVENWYLGELTVWLENWRYMARELTSLVGNWKYGWRTDDMAGKLRWRTDDEDGELILWMGNWWYGCRTDMAWELTVCSENWHWLENSADHRRIGSGCKWIKYSFPIDDIGRTIVEMFSFQCIKFRNFESVVRGLLEENQFSLLF